jgi:hypothetical protein
MLKNDEYHVQRKQPEGQPKDHEEIERESDKRNTNALMPN